MSIKAHIESLNEKHQKIEEQLHEAVIHRLPTAELKKEKLKLKDEIYHLKQQDAA